MTRDSIRSSLTDEAALVATLVGEVRGEPIEGQVAVASVIRNRVNFDIRSDNKPDWWGEGYIGVCTKPKQFSCWNDGDPNASTVYAVAEGLITGLPLGANIAQLRWIAQGIIEGVIASRVRDADHYLTARLYESITDRNHWARKRAPLMQVGSHVFFKLET